MKINRILAALSAACVCFASVVSMTEDAHADYFITTPTVQAPNTALVPVHAGNVGSAILNLFSPVDASGAAFGIGTNPFAVSFGTGVTLPQFGSPAHFICDSGCGGGGGSSYTVTYGNSIGTLGTPAGFKDASGNFQSFLGDTTNGEWVNIHGLLPAFASVPTVNIGTIPTVAVTGTFFQATQPVSAVSLPLPASASTSALQTTGNTSLATIATNTPPLGQALAGSSVPVVLPATQITALTPPTSVGISGTLPAYASPPTVLSFAANPKASITRSANTTTYTANTGWNSGTATFFSFTAACRVNGGQVLIPRIDVWSSANPTTKLTGVLWLFAGVPGTNIADDATFTIAAADFANLTGSVGGIPFTLGNNQASGATNSGSSLTGVTYQGQCAAGSTTITGMVEVTNAYVPASAEILNVGISTVGVN